MEKPTIIKDIENIFNTGFENYHKEKNYSQKDFNLLLNWDNKTFYYNLVLNKDYFELNENKLIQIGLIYQNLFNNTNQDKIFKEFKINENLSQLLQDTTNKVDELQPLPFDNIFINNEIKFKNYVIKGVSVFTIDNKILFTIILLDEKNLSLNGFSFMEDEYLNYSKFYSKNQLKCIEFVRQYFNNFLDLLNSNEEIEKYEVKGNDLKSNQKRVSKNKYPKNDFISIKPIKELNKYVLDYTLQKNNKAYNHKFMVRGHFRDLKSKRFKENKRIWIKPYIKGEGIFINKSYKIEK